MHRRPGVRATVGSTVAVLSGCAEHRLTREPEPPVSDLGWFLIWAAAVLAGVVATVHLVRAFARVPLPHRRRLLAGTLFAAGAVALAAAYLYVALTALRASHILGWDECRRIPPEARPVQIIQLSCSRGADELGLTVLSLTFFAALLLGPAALLLLCTASLVRGRERPWLPAVLASSVAFGAVVQAGAAVGEDTGGAEWLALSAVVVGAGAAARWCWVEVLRSR